MSAPDTNTDTQTEKHRPALFGIGAAMLWGGVLLVGLIVWTAYNGNTPEDTGPQVEVMPGTGATLEDQ